MQDYVGIDSRRVLGVTAVDLYIPILTFVFGESQIGGPCGLVSAYRLRQEFYGFPQIRDPSATASEGSGARSDIPSI
jgi:archaemetzincin